MDFPGYPYAIMASFFTRSWLMKHLILILVAALLSSCATLEEWNKEWILENCNSVAAYNAGMTQGLTPHTNPDPNFASRCPTNKNTINTAYLKGFSEGARSRPKEVTINKNVNLNTNQSQ